MLFTLFRIIQYLLTFTLLDGKVQEMGDILRATGGGYLHVEPTA
jgi:hypothetical protein